jgi:hypothetical protein
MRRLLTGLVSGVAMLGTVVVGVAGPAHASTVDCGRDVLLPSMPDVGVLTCVEAAGNQRRATSIVENRSAHDITFVEFIAGLSYPNYAWAECASRVEPVTVRAGERMSCTTSWMPDISRPHSKGLAHTGLRFHDVDGRYWSRGFSYRAPLTPST